MLELVTGVLFCIFVIVIDGFYIVLFLLLQGFSSGIKASSNLGSCLIRPFGAELLQIFDSFDTICVEYIWFSKLENTEANEMSDIVRID